MKKTSISQCMIVKNEEKNIERALAWGKGTVKEQIVVDTGSTDRTVEIAESMGAKVYHFKWIDDFAAAKNYALEQAKGDWIVFLDADEYFDKDEAKMMSEYLNTLPLKRGQNPVLIRCSLVNLDDEGKPKGTVIKTRIFSNYCGIKYTGRIHECLFIGKDYPIHRYTLTDLSIYHTGYTSEAYSDTNKTQRNRELLLKEIDLNPENPWNHNYMGDGYSADKDYEKALEFYNEAVDRYWQSAFYQNDKEGREILIVSAYSGVLKMMCILEECNAEVYLSIYDKAVSVQPDYPDYDFWRGYWSVKRQDWKDVIRSFERTIDKCGLYTGDAQCVAGSQMSKISSELVKASRFISDIPRTIKYSILSLKLDKYQDEALATLLITLLKDRKDEDRTEVLSFLKMLYDFNSLKDKLFIIKCSKSIRDDSLRAVMMNTLSSKEQELLNKGHKTKLITDIRKQNGLDTEFLHFMEQIHNKTEGEIETHISNTLEQIQKQEPKKYEKLAEATSKFKYWGKLSPEHGEKGLAQIRAEFFKKKESWLIEFYDRLADNRSKRTWLSILFHLYYLEGSYLREVKDGGKQYFDLDIIPNAIDGIFVDIGAHMGDITQDFFQTYEDYKKIYCYEANTFLANQLQYSLFPVKNVEIRNKAVYSKEGVVFLEYNKFSSYAATVTESPNHEESHVRLDAVTLDTDLQEAATLIKVNTAGCELEVLTGCKDQISKHHPVLAVNISNNIENIWQIADLIDTLGNNYEFYLRYYGGELLPENCILYAV